MTTYPRTARNTKAHRARAIADLGINVPIYRTRIAGGRLHLHLYGGQVLIWPPLPRLTSSDGGPAGQELGTQPLEDLVETVPNDEVAP